MHTTNALPPITYRGLVYTASMSATGWTVQTCKEGSAVPGAIRRYKSLALMQAVIPAFRAQPLLAQSTVVH